MHGIVRRFGWYSSAIFAAVLVIPMSSVGNTCLVLSQGTRASRDQVSERIHVLVRQTVESHTTTLKDGTLATTMPVNPSNSDMHEVLGYGVRAVEVLESYVNSKSATEQHVAFRFLTEFQGERAFDAIAAFAERSSFSGIRAEAAVDISNFPGPKSRALLERITSSDPSPDVRAAATRALAQLQPAARRK